MCLKVVDMGLIDRLHRLGQKDIITSTERVMGLYALANILSVPGGRTEFLGIFHFFITVRISYEIFIKG